MLWVVGEENLYFSTLQDALKGAGQAPTVLTEDECVRKLQAYFEDENTILKKKLYIIASVGSVGLLDKLADVS